MDAELAATIDRTGDLKGLLIDYARTPRFERYLREALEAAASQQGGILDEGSASQAMDDFIFTHRTGANRTLIDDFLAQRRALSPEDRQILLGWRDPVDGLFEIKRKGNDSMLLLNLIDDLEYSTYSNMGPGTFRRLPKGGFAQGRLVPVAGVWIVSGVLAVFPRSGAGDVARAAAELAMRVPRWVFRNPELLAQSWELQRSQRAEFIEAFGGDELVVPPAEAEDRLRQLGNQRDDTPRLPPQALECETVGLVYDEDDGLSVLLDYGMLKEMFADPGLARDRPRAELLLSYLRSDLIKPGVLRRLAVAYPAGADAVYRAVLRQRHFTWSAHGEALLRKHKPWYFETEQYPGVIAVGSRLSELARS